MTPSKDLPALRPAQRPELPFQLEEGAPPRVQFPAPHAGVHEEHDWHVYLAAVKRFRWLVAGVVVLGTIAGFVSARRVKPEYRARATLWIEVADRRGRDPTAIGFEGLMRASALADLVRSGSVLEGVTRNQRLYLKPGAGERHPALGSFDVTRDYRPGSYRVVVDDSGKAFHLSSTDGAVQAQGLVGDSIGAALGFTWAPPDSLLEPGTVVEFTLESPGVAARKLATRIRLDTVANFMHLELRGTDPDGLTAAVNDVADRFVEVAADLKRRKLTELSSILDEARRRAQGNLRGAEGALRDFRVRNVTRLARGRDGSTAPAGGVFTLQLSLDEVRRDRQAIEGALAHGPGTGLSASSLEMIDAVQRSSELMAVLQGLTGKRAELRALRQQYTDEHPAVRRLADDVAEMEHRTIPALAGTLVSDLRARERELQNQMADASQDLRAIPSLTIEEARLERDVALAEQNFATVQARYDEARLAEASAIADVRVLDPAAEAHRPVTNTMSLMVSVAFVGSLGLGLVGAVLLDRADPKFRYPEQVSEQVGLAILGVVPHVGRKDAGGGTGALQVIEALRVIRLRLMHSYGAAGPILVTVTSPGSGEGKSFVTVNLALAFADAGFQTLLVDADIRRGGLHRILSVQRRPGLTDYLAGEIGADELVQTTAYSRLDFIACGARRHHGPELLGSAAMTQLTTSLQTRYQVILIDSPPLAAGVDAYTLATLTGHLLLVVRTGVTERQLAEAKLTVLDRLPVRILGAVLNDARADGAYRYYSYYLEGYELENEDPAAHDRKVLKGAV